MRLESALQQSQSVMAPYATGLSLDNTLRAVMVCYTVDYDNG